MKITKKLLHTWGACWDDRQIDGYLHGRTHVTPRQVAMDKTISANDRMWVLSQALWKYDKSAARCFAIECAMSVAHLAGNENDREHYSGLCNWLLEIEDLTIRQRSYARSAAALAAEIALPHDARGVARSVWVAVKIAAGGRESTAWCTAFHAAPHAAAAEDYIVIALEWLGTKAD